MNLTLINSSNFTQYFEYLGACIKFPSQHFGHRAKLLSHKNDIYTKSRRVGTALIHFSDIVYFFHAFIAYYVMKKSMEYKKCGTARTHPISLDANHLIPVGEIEHPSQRH